MKKYSLFPLLMLFFSYAVSGQVKIKKSVSDRKLQTISTNPIDTTKEQGISGQQQQQTNVRIITTNNSNELQMAHNNEAYQNFKLPYDFSNVKICVDKQTDYDPGPRPIKTYPEIPRLNSNGQLEPGVARQKLSVETKKMWPTESVITVAFAPNETTDFVQNQVMKFARIWETVANVRFNFTNDYRNAMVKIRFVKGDGSWSWLGREVLHNPFGNATMNFGWFDNNTSEAEFSRVVLHEFGHTLGFVHEHQTAGAAINWDVPKVYAFFGGAPNNWSQAQVDANIFSKYSQTSTNGTVYDRTSIMHYFFPEGLTTDNTSFTSNTTLSSLDKQFAKEIYPSPPTPSNASGVLHTGDDCDAIQFTVEYNVVPNNTIEFTMQPGIDNSGRPVSWWKQIGIPLVGGGEDRNLQMLTDGSMVKTTILRNNIDETRGMSFAKAKFLGVHTGLAFTWKVWQALPGGCRVRFVWQNDHCY